MRAYQFVRPTKPYRELAILTEIGKNEAVSQRGLARVAMVSATLVNAYIDGLLEGGLVDVSGETNRTYRYRLTPDGEARRQALAADAAREVIRFFEEMKGDFRLVPEVPPGVSASA